jgi:Spy/CpxP family protein refolding chaperone
MVVPWKPEKQAKIQQIHQATHQQVEAILTPEQKKTMREWRREHKGSRRQQAPPASN